MTMLEFMNDSPMLTFFLVWMITHFVTALFCRLLRTINIAMRGYPTAKFMDADGDIVHPKKED